MLPIIAQSVPVSKFWPILDGSGDFMSRKTRLGALAALILIVVLVLLVNYVQGQQLSPQDQALQATAGRFAAALKEPDSRYSAISDSLQAFNLYQHDQQVVLQKQTRALAGPHDFAEIVLWETKTMPPNSLMVRNTNKPVLNVSGAAVSKAASGSDSYTTVTAGSRQWRVYVTSIQPPPTIMALDAHEVLEIYHPVQ
jgi:hypothetical protein